ncbi:hypothetical protein K439DRAFT_1328861 [Ramaria rubella]|nr:hypothetical protein K439DRAFT_1328861 [Ramaria rubella]
MASDNNDCPILSDVTIFQIWKICVMSELCNKKVWELVDGTEVDPGPTVTIYPSYYHGMDTWKVRDGKAHSTIVKYLSNALTFKHVTMPQMAKQLWDLRWDGTTDIHKHISKIHAADKRLAGMKRQLDNEVMAYALLHSLPKTP